MSMSAKVERDLSSGNKDLVKRARDAFQSKNYDYTISLLQTVLKSEPLFLEGRRSLRRAEINRYQALNSFARQMTGMKVTAMSLGAKGNPQDQLIHAEEILAIDPFHQKANLVIADAGVALGLSEMKAFAYETLAEHKPNDKGPLHQLAKVYMELKEPGKAEQVYEKIRQIDPLDGEAISGIKNASAARASQQGKWDEGGDYRTNLRNKEQAAQLEQESRVVKSSDAIEEQIQRLYAQHQADPQNVLPPKQIAQLYVQKNDLEAAIQWYQFAYDLGGQTDSALEKIIGDLRMQRIDQEFQAYQNAVSAETDPERQAELQAGLEQKIAERNQIRLAQAEQRVQHHPNDGQYRFELGEALFHVGQYQRALKELQQGLKQPSVRHQALSLMGQCQMALRMYDLAINTFASAEAELTTMDDIKKEIVYHLGRAYDAMGDRQKGLEQDKKIYTVDMGYRDVEQRVVSSYGS